MSVGSEALPKEEVSFATRQSFSLAQKATLNLLLCFRLRAPQVSIILKPIVSALAYIHSHGIIHRDVRAESILISSKGNIKLSSFSLATQVRRTRLVIDSKTCPLVLNACNFISLFSPKAHHRNAHLQDSSGLPVLVGARSVIRPRLHNCL